MKHTFTKLQLINLQSFISDVVIYAKSIDVTVIPVSKKSLKQFETVYKNKEDIDEALKRFAELASRANIVVEVEEENKALLEASIDYWESRLEVEEDEIDEQPEIDYRDMTPAEQRCYDADRLNYYNQGERLGA